MAWVAAGRGTSTRTEASGDCYTSRASTSILSSSLGEIVGVYVRLTPTPHSERLAIQGSWKITPESA